MVKNKRDLLKSPRRRSLPLGRTSVRSKLTGGANICVVVRVRPPNANECGNNSRDIIKVVSDDSLIFDPKEDDEPFFYHGVQQKCRDLLKKANKNSQFRFDRVFGFNSNNEEIFEKSTKSLIETLMEGYNCSVFAYGATGAGKTFTMLGKPDNPGITVLTMRELFKRKEELSCERDFELGITYVEVYNENVQDLLNPGCSLHLREDGKYGVVVAGIQVKRIENSEELFDLLYQGNRNRTQHPTDANAESSRSHAVFQVYLKMTIKTTMEVRVAKLSMIDLAGSERGAATGYSGARFTEGANINKSLLALGNCINSLADGHRHVPYRDSKLTRLLKDSLGGNCRTIMIANISPSSLNYEDTYNTLKYAVRAKKIKSKMKKNVVNCNMNIQHYIKQNEELQQEIELLKAQLDHIQTYCTCGPEKSLALVSPRKVEKEEAEALTEKSSALSEIKMQIEKLYNEKQAVEEQIGKIQNSKALFEIRRHMKEEEDSRLSGLCTELTEKKSGHRRFGNTVDKLKRQAESLEEKLKGLRHVKEQLEIHLQKLVPEDSLELKEYVHLQESEIEKIQLKLQSEYYQKVCEIQSGELRLQGELIERMCLVLKPCFLQLRGHGFASDDMIKNYKDLVRHFQGLRSVTWKDIDKLSIDSKVSCAPDFDIPSDRRRTPNKRKMQDENHDPNTGLNGTFVLATPSQKFQDAPEKVTVKAKAKSAEKLHKYRKPDIKPTTSKPRLNVWK